MWLKWWSVRQLDRLTGISINLTEMLKLQKITFFLTHRVHQRIQTGTYNNTYEGFFSLSAQWKWRLEISRGPSLPLLAVQCTTSINVRHWSWKSVSSFFCFCAPSKNIFVVVRSGLLLSGCQLRTVIFLHLQNPPALKLPCRFFGGFSVAIENSYL